MKVKHLIRTSLALLFVFTVISLFSQQKAQQQSATYSNNSGKPIAQIGNSPRNQTGGVWLYDSFGELVVEILSFRRGGYARFYQKRGKDRLVLAYIGPSTKGRGIIQVNGKNVHDYADIFDFATRNEVIPGTVMSMLESGVGLVPSSEPYDAKVVGVISGAGGFSPGMSIGNREDSSQDLPIAVSGQVYVRVCLEGGPIKVGDLLVSSSQPGVATRATDRERAFGAVIGKALEPYTGKLAESKGLVRMLVMNR